MSSTPRGCSAHVLSNPGLRGEGPISLPLDDGGFDGKVACYLYTTRAHDTARAGSRTRVGPYTSFPWLSQEYMI